MQSKTILAAMAILMTAIASPIDQAPSNQNRGLLTPVSSIQNKGQKRPGTFALPNTGKYVSGASSTPRLRNQTNVQPQFLVPVSQAHPDQKFGQLENGIGIVVLDSIYAKDSVGLEVSFIIPPHNYTECMLHFQTTFDVDIQSEPHKPCQVNIYGYKHGSRRISVHDTYNSRPEVNYSMTVGHLLEDTDYGYYKMGVYNSKFDCNLGPTAQFYLEAVTNECVLYWEQSISPLVGLVLIGWHRD